MQLIIQTICKKIDMHKKYSDSVTIFSNNANAYIYEYAIDTYMHTYLCLSTLKMIRKRAHNAENAVENANVISCNLFCCYERGRRPSEFSLNMMIFSA